MGFPQVEHRTGEPVHEIGAERGVIGLRFQRFGECARQCSGLGQQIVPRRRGRLGGGWFGGVGGDELAQLLPE